MEDTVLTIRIKEMDNHNIDINAFIGYIESLGKFKVMGAVRRTEEEEEQHECACQRSW